MYRYFFFPDHCIKQIHSILLWVCSTIDHRRRENVVKTITSLRRVCHVSVFTTFWRQLWSITEQTLGNMESVCWIAITAIHVCDDESYDRIHFFVKFLKAGFHFDRKKVRTNKPKFRFDDTNFASKFSLIPRKISRYNLLPSLRNFTDIRTIDAPKFRGISPNFDVVRFLWW